MGGKDWKVQPRTSAIPLGAEDPFTVEYVGNTYSIRVDLNKMPEDRAVQINFWNGDILDRYIEGVSPVGRTQVLDIVFSAKSQP